jgi:ABC-type amino acid transport substrate-binding protein
MLGLRSGLAAGAVACVAACVVAACSSGATTGQAAGADAASLKLVQPGTLTVAITPGGLPFNTVGSNGQASGMFAVINDDIAKRLGLNVTFDATSLSGALQGLAAGRYDVISIGVIETAAREKTLTLTKPLWWGTHADVLERTGDVTTDLTGKRVGANTGSIEVTFAKSQIKGADVVSEPSLTAGLNELLSGNLAAFVIGDTQAGAILAQYPTKIKVGLTGPQNTPIVEAINSKETALKTAYDQQLTDLADNGTLLKLIEQYVHVTPAQIPAQLLQYWPGLVSSATSSGSAAPSGSATPSGSASVTGSAASAG